MAMKTRHSTDPPAPSSFIQLISPVIALIEDELNRPSTDLSAKLLYDDLNEIFWRKDLLLSQKVFFWRTKLKTNPLYHIVLEATRLPSLCRESRVARKTFREARHPWALVCVFERFYLGMTTFLCFVAWLYARNHDETLPGNLTADEVWSGSIVALSGCLACPVLLSILSGLFITPLPIPARVEAALQAIRRPACYASIIGGGVRLAIPILALGAVSSHGLQATTLRPTGGTTLLLIGYLVISELGRFFLSVAFRQNPLHSSSALPSGTSFLHRWEFTRNFAGNISSTPRGVSDAVTAFLFWGAVLGVKGVIVYYWQIDYLLSSVEDFIRPKAARYSIFGKAFTDPTGLSFAVLISVPLLLLHYIDIYFYFQIFASLWHWGSALISGRGLMASLNEARGVFWLLPLHYDRLLQPDAGGFFRHPPCSSRTPPICGCCASRRASSSSSGRKGWNALSYFTSSSQVQYVRSMPSFTSTLPSIVAINDTPFMGGGGEILLISTAEHLSPPHRALPLHLT